MTYSFNIKKSKAKRANKQYIKNAVKRETLKHKNSKQKVEGATQIKQPKKKEESFIDQHPKLKSTLKKVPGGRKIIGFLDKSAGKNLIITIAKIGDIISQPFANLPGGEIQHKKFRSTGIGFIIFGTIALCLLSGLLVEKLAINSLKIPATMQIAAWLLSIGTVSIGISFCAASIRLKYKRTLIDMVLNKVDKSPALKQGVIIKLDKVELSLNDCHTNIGCLGGIGTGKTVAVMNPLLDQFFCQLNTKEPTEAQKQKKEYAWWHKDIKQKCGALILDQKGDFVDYVIYTMLRYGRPLEDLVIIDPSLDLYCYNPLDPEASAEDNANKLGQIQKIVAGGGGGSKDKFWDDASKATVKNFLTMLEVIKPKEKIGLDDLAKYIREDELSEYLCDKVEKIVDTKYAEGKMDYNSKTTYTDAVSAARNEWINTSENVKSTLKVTISQLLGGFASDPRLQKVFCRNTNFNFKQVINEGKVVLYRGGSISEETSKVICVALKLDFQTWAKRRNGSMATEFGLNTTRTCLFFADEFQEFVTQDDGKFFGVSRSAKVAGITATQGLISYKLALGDDKAVDTLRQNIGTWIFLRTTDLETAKLGEELAGQSKKEQLSTSVKTAGLLENATQLTGPQNDNSSSYNISKSLEANYRKDEFMKLDTVAMEKSSTGPYYSEAFIYHYHSTDTNRESRMYKCKLRHIYDIDQEYAAAYPKKTTQNTADFNLLMYDRHAQMKILYRINPAVEKAWEDNKAVVYAQQAEQKKQEEAKAKEEKEKKEKEEKQKTTKGLLNSVITTNTSKTEENTNILSIPHNTTLYAEELTDTKVIKQMIVDAEEQLEVEKGTKQEKFNQVFLITTLKQKLKAIKIEEIGKKIIDINNKHIHNVT